MNEVSTETSNLHLRTDRRMKDNAKALLIALLSSADRPLSSTELRGMINAVMGATTVSLRQVVETCHDWKSVEWLQYEHKARGWVASPLLRKLELQEVLQMGTT